MRQVELMVRTTCGSCERVRAQITPVVAAAGAHLEVRNVDEASELNVEYGDRVPVVVIDGKSIMTNSPRNSKPLRVTFQ